VLNESWHIESWLRFIGLSLVTTGLPFMVWKLVASVEVKEESKKRKKYK
jgi:hypothetical protein